MTYMTTTLSTQSTFRTVELQPFLVARPPGSTGNLQVREYIKTQMRIFGWLVEEDTSVQQTPVGALPFVNVIATQNPSARSRLIFACHYDSKLTPLGFVGATDAAVPCALLINTARLMTPFLNILRSELTIQFVFFDGEEPLADFAIGDGFYGSRHLANVWQLTLDRNDITKNNLQTIAAFILLDLIGQPDTQFQRFYPATDQLYTFFRNFELCLLTRGFLTRPLVSSFLFSNSRRTVEIVDDQKPFLDLGLQQVMHLIGYPFPSVWHTLGDNEAALDDRVIEDMARLLRVAILNFAANTAVIS